MAIDQNRQRIQDDLRGQVAGEVRCDDVFLQMYASDGSIYEVKPLGVIRPRSTQDVAVAVRYAHDNCISIHPRGGGSGLAGGCLGTGLVLDFSRFMNRVVDVKADSVTVQPGVVLTDLNETLRPFQQQFGVDPATREVTTLGGMLARDAKGSRWLKYGSPRDHVMSLRVVLADGSEATLTRNQTVTPLAENESTVTRLAREVSQLVTQNSEVIARAQHVRPFRAVVTHFTMS